MKNGKSGPVQSEKAAVRVGVSRLWWKRFVEKMSFEPGMKQWAWWTVRVVRRREMNIRECDVTSSAGCFMQGWRNETGSWFQRWGDAKRNGWLVMFTEEDVVWLWNGGQG